MGDRVTIKNAVLIWDRVRIEDDVFVGPNVVFTNDPNPRAAFKKPAELIRRRRCVERGATLGANATIVCGVTIGAHAFVGAGAVVTQDVPRARRGRRQSRPAHRLDVRVRRQARRAPALRVRPRAIAASAGPV